MWWFFHIIMLIIDNHVSPELQLLPIIYTYLHVSLSVLKTHCQYLPQYTYTIMYIVSCYMFSWFSIRVPCLLLCSTTYIGFVLQNQTWYVCHAIIVPMKPSALEIREVQISIVQGWYWAPWPISIYTYCSCILGVHADQFSAITFPLLGLPLELGITTVYFNCTSQ